MSRSLSPVHDILPAAHPFLPDQRASSDLSLGDQVVDCLLGHWALLRTVFLVVPHDSAPITSLRRAARYAVNAGFTSAVRRSRHQMLEFVGAPSYPSPRTRVGWHHVPESAGTSVVRLRRPSTSIWAPRTRVGLALPECTTDRVGWHHRPVPESAGTSVSVRLRRPSTSVWAPRTRVGWHYPSRATRVGWHRLPTRVGSYPSRLVPPPALDHFLLSL